ncbi:MAG: hypothetical protein AABN34_15260 [Acidobacteriota bacterium]
MAPNRVMSLNEISNEFSVEELEPRMEMQMLGFGVDPRIIIGDTFIIIIVIATSTGIWII